MNSAIKITILLAAILVIVLVVVSCKINPTVLNPNRTLKENIIVDHNDDGSYGIRLEPPGEWKVYQGEAPDKIDWTKSVKEVNGDFLELPASMKEKKRLFFGLIAPTGDSVIVSERLIPMEGQPNFRDLGGLPAVDGRYVKWGHLYRSGNLTDLTKDDLRYFSHLGIQSIVDLRNNIEIAKDPDKFPKDVKYYHHSLSDKEGQAYNRLRQMVLREGYRRTKAKALFEEVMRSFADTLATDVKPVFDMLLNEKTETPLLYHCSGGKDRTGYLSAMILSSLGVQRDVIVQDYLMSNYYRRDKNISSMRKARLIGLDSETLEYAMLVREEYMNAVFDVIDKKYGGTDKYLETKFGLTPEKRQLLVERYTAPYQAKIVVALPDTTQAAEPVVEDGKN